MPPKRTKMARDTRPTVTLGQKMINMYHPLQKLFGLVGQLLEVVFEIPVEQESNRRSLRNRLKALNGYIDDIQVHKNGIEELLKQPDRAMEYLEHIVEAHLIMDKMVGEVERLRQRIKSTNSAMYAQLDNLRREYDVQRERTVRSARELGKLIPGLEVEQKLQLRQVRPPPRQVRPPSPAKAKKPSTPRKERKRPPSPAKRKPSTPRQKTKRPSTPRQKTKRLPSPAPKERKPSTPRKVTEPRPKSGFGSRSKSKSRPKDAKSSEKRKREDSERRKPKSPSPRGEPVTAEDLFGSGPAIAPAAPSSSRAPSRDPERRERIDKMHKLMHRLSDYIENLQTRWTRRTKESNLEEIRGYGTLSAKYRKVLRSATKMLGHFREILKNIDRDVKDPEDVRDLHRMFRQKTREHTKEIGKVIEALEALFAKEPTDPINIPKRVDERQLLIDEQRAEKKEQEEDEKKKKKKRKEKGKGDGSARRKAKEKAKQQEEEQKRKEAEEKDRERFLRDVQEHLKKRDQPLPEVKPVVEGDLYDHDAVDDGPVDDGPVDDYSVEDHPVEDHPVEDHPVEDQPADQGQKPISRSRPLPRAAAESRQSVQTREANQNRDIIEGHISGLYHRWDQLPEDIKDVINRYNNMIGRIRDVDRTVYQHLPSYHKCMTAMYNLIMNIEDNKAPKGLIKKAQGAMKAFLGEVKPLVNQKSEAEIEPDDVIDADGGDRDDGVDGEFPLPPGPPDALNPDEHPVIPEDTAADVLKRRTWVEKQDDGKTHVHWIRNYEGTPFYFASKKHRQEHGKKPERSRTSHNSRKRMGMHLHRLYRKTDGSWGKQYWGRAWSYEKRAPIYSTYNCTNEDVDPWKLAADGEIYYDPNGPAKYAYRPTGTRPQCYQSGVHLKMLPNKGRQPKMKVGRLNQPVVQGAGGGQNQQGRYRRQHRQGRVPRYGH